MKKNTLAKKIYSTVGIALVKTSVKMAVDSASFLNLYQPKAPKNIK